jgi:hypothetical protein
MNTQSAAVRSEKANCLLHSGWVFERCYQASSAGFKLSYQAHVSEILEGHVTVSFSAILVKAQLQSRQSFSCPSVPLNGASFMDGSAMPGSKNCELMTSLKNYFI